MNYIRITPIRLTAIGNWVGENIHSSYRVVVLDVLSLTIVSEGPVDKNNMGADYDLVQNRLQAVTSPSYELVYWRIYVSPGPMIYYIMSKGFLCVITIYVWRQYIAGRHGISE